MDYIIIYPQPHETCLNITLVTTVNGKSWLTRDRERESDIEKEWERGGENCIITLSGHIPSKEQASCNLMRNLCNDFFFVSRFHAINLINVIGLIGVLDILTKLLGNCKGRYKVSAWVELCVLICIFYGNLYNSKQYINPLPTVEFEL